MWVPCPSQGRSHAGGGLMPSHQRSLLQPQLGPHVSGTFQQGLRETEETKARRARVWTDRTETRGCKVGACHGQRSHRAPFPTRCDLTPCCVWVVNMCHEVPLGQVLSDGQEPSE